jgi:hypothetical protein
LELLKACRERAIDRQIARAGATLEMHLVDLPSSWFAQGFELLRHCGWTRFHSLRADGGGFRPLAEVVGRGTIDVAVANMVFHLVPPAALWRVAADLASVMVPGGRLFWNSPDLGPAGPYSVLFHDANRALRARWLELLATAAATGSGPVDEAVRRACARLDQSDMRIAQNRADRQVLPRANAAVDVERALAVHFSGELVYRTYEILEQDVVDTLLVPANQAEFLSEIDDRQLREAVIRELMVGEVLPAMRAKPGGTAVGLNVQWSLGSYTLGTTPNLA